MVKVPHFPILPNRRGLSLVMLGPTIFDMPGSSLLLDGLLTSITYARMFLRLQDGDDLHGLYLKAAREPYTDFTSWIEAIEENVTLLCDLVPTIQSIVNEAC